MKARAALVIVALSACDRPKPTPAPAASAAPAASVSITVDASAPSSSTEDSIVKFDDETVGEPTRAFEAVVGDWEIGRAADAVGLKVDGSRWRDGTPSTNLADQAKRLYGDRYAEFLDGVKTFAFYPLAIRKELPPKDLRVSMRFYPIAGKIDQAAGIAFSITPDGSYWGARANALEDNILFFKVVKGKRTVIDTIRNTPTPSKTWHTFAVEVRGGKQITVFLDNTKRLDKTLDQPLPTGHVGLWSKADSQVLFDDFEIATLNR